MRFFQFKQFRITDDRSAMKVGTDAVILGSWLSENNYSRILDIGCGSGIIALMMAQRFENAQIVGVDIDEGSIKDAQFNIADSPWNNRLKIIQSDISLFVTNQKFDLIISNPPFFTGSKLPPLVGRAAARHDEKLSLDSLLLSVSRLMKAEAVFALVFPFDRSDLLFDKAAEYGLYPQRILHSRNKPDAQIKRIFVEFKIMKNSGVEVEVLDIRNKDNKYSDEYLQLTKDFYLKLKN